MHWSFLCKIVMAAWWIQPANSGRETLNLKCNINTLWTVWFLLHLRHFFRINPRTCMHTRKKYLGLKYSSTMKQECLGSISKHVSLMLDRPYWVSCFMTIVINFRRFTTSSFNKWSVKIWWLWSNTNALRFSFVFYNNLKKRTTNKHTHLL